MAHLFPNLEAQEWEFRNLLMNHSALRREAAELAQEFRGIVR